MQSALASGIVLAALGSLSLNIGKGLQKWKVHALRSGRAMPSTSRRRDLGIWIVGVALAASSSPLYYVALSFTDKPSLVSMLHGVGLIGLVLFSWLVLGERIGPKELAGALVVIFGTALMGAADVPLDQMQQLRPAHLLAIGVLLLLLLPAAARLAWRRRRWHGLVLGAIPGVLAGLSVVLGDAGLAAADNSLLGGLLTPYPWLALLLSLIALGATQLAFLGARAITVVPIGHVFVILTPALLEPLVFGSVLAPLQYLAVAANIGGVVLLTQAEVGVRSAAR